MYAVVVPGFSCIYETWAEVERIKALYFYPKFAKVRTEEEAQEFIRRNRMRHYITDVYNYGDVMKDLHVKAWYKIGNNCVFYKINTKKLGHVKMHVEDDALVEYHGDDIYIRLNNIKLSPKAINSHLAAIYNLLLNIGRYVDVQLYLPNFSIYYALTNYSGQKSKQIPMVKQLIEDREGNVSFNLIGVNLEQ